MAILHGGQLSRVAKQYQIPEDKWCDLSTGIAPFSYLIPNIPDKYWQELPTISQRFVDVAKDYYQAKYCWPLAGSQQLIEKLPQLWEKKINDDVSQIKRHVYLPQVGYKEHQQAWCKAGYQLHFYQKELPTEIQINSVVVVINPNNPLTDTFSIEQLIALKERCTQKQALLVIDEAFADIFDAQFSIVPHLHDQTENVIVLRSFGKFFGLAGLRIGFVCSTQKWCELIQEEIGPWSINGPALYIAELALKDRCWQDKQKQRLEEQSHKMQKLLMKNLPVKRFESNALFITVFLDNAAAVYEKLCQHAIYARLTDENDSLRFGIADDRQLQQLKLTMPTLS